MLRGSKRCKLLATWHLFLLSTALADLAEVLAGDDECSVDGCSTDLLQVNWTSGSKDSPSPEAKEKQKGSNGSNGSNVSIGNFSAINASANATAINASLKSGSGWVGCWYYGCRRSYHPEFYCQCNPSCRKYGSCCPDFSSRCWWLKPSPSPPPEGRRRDGRRRDGRRRRRAPPPSPPPWTPSPPSDGLRTGYHQTSPQACKAILASAFRPGSDGHCGGAIYFALSPEATKTKAIGYESQTGCVIEAKIDVGRVKKEGPRCGHKWEQGELRSAGFDSIEFDPGDGQEIVIFDPNRVKSMREIPYNNAWKPTYNVR